VRKPADQAAAGFPCTQCGACCKSLVGYPEYEDLDRGDGVCRHYDEEGRQCRIYDARPLKCRIDEAYSVHVRSVVPLSLEEYYRMNARACNELQAKIGISEGYRVMIP
jgi:Fe-S-cluster containining protein